MRILIVKLSSLGDVVHALPVVADLRTMDAAAVVDWVVEPAFAPLLHRVAGIAEVIELPLRRWTRQGLWRALVDGEPLAFWRRLRRHRYDAVLELQGLSKAAFVAWAARGPSYGLANRTEGASHEAPARWLATHAISVPSRSHALDRSRELVHLALGTAIETPPRFGLPAAAPIVPRPRSAPPGFEPALGERASGQVAPRATDAIDATPVVMVHGSSRTDKLWPESNWIELGRRLVAAGDRVALPQSDAEEAARAGRVAAGIGAGAEVWPALDLGALVDRMGASSGVIGVDSGPSHIAVALGLPHVQIYNHATAWRTGPQPGHGKTHQLSVEGKPTPSVDAVWRAWQAVRGTADPVAAALVPP